jgi:hypothetical protein
MEARPRIKRYGDQLGLQVAYARSDMIGHVTGEIIPPNTDLEAVGIFHPEPKALRLRDRGLSSGHRLTRTKMEGWVNDHFGAIVSIRIV